MNDKQRGYDISVSRDIIIYGLSITILFIFLDLLQKAIDLTFGLREYILLIIGIFILFIGIFYLRIGIKKDWFTWLQAEDFSWWDIWVNMSSAIFIGSLTKLLISIADLIATGFTFGYLVVLIIVIILMILTRPRAVYYKIS